MLTIIVFEEPNMKVKCTLFLLVTLLLPIVSAAQKKEFKFAKIDPQEFQVKPFGADSSAAAVKLFDVGNVHFEYNQIGFVYIFERHVRFKIINKNAYDLADFQIPLYRTSKRSEELIRMEAATYNLESGNMLTTKLNKDAKFTEKFNKNYQIKKYTLGNVKEGAIIEYKYTIRSPFIFNLKSWSFQSSVPTVYSEYNLKLPEYLIYKPTFTGDQKIKRTIDKTIATSYIPRITSNAGYTQYVLENAPALKQEAYITTMDDYNSAIYFELMATRFPNTDYKDLTGTWPKIIKVLAEDKNFGLFVAKNEHTKSILPTIVKSETDTLKIINLIYNYVKRNVKWDEDYSLYTNETNPKLILDRKIGSSADINLLLLNFLKAANINANPLLISTRENGTHPGMPQISKFNSVLVSLTLDNKNLLLDATNQDHALGMVAYQNLNHKGLSINLDSHFGKWIMTEPFFTDEKIQVHSLTLDKAHQLKGSMFKYYKGYSALSLRNRYRANATEAEYVKGLKRNKQGLEINSYKLYNLDNFEEILYEELAVNISENVEEAGNLIFLTPLLFERTKENIFKLEQRTYPVDLGFPIKENIRVSINFPEEYDIETLPKSGNFKLPDNKGSFSISFLTQDKTVLVTSIIEINKTVFTPNEYFDVKELFKIIVEKQAEKIVFKKKS